MEATAIAIGFVAALALVELYRVGYRAGWLAARESLNVSGNDKMLQTTAPAVLVERQPEGPASIEGWAR